MWTDCHGWMRVDCAAADTCGWMGVDVVINSDFYDYTIGGNDGDAVDCNDDDDTWWWRRLGCGLWWRVTSERCVWEPW